MYALTATKMRIFLLLPHQLINEHSLRYLAVSSYCPAPNMISASCIFKCEPNLRAAMQIMM